MLLQTRLQEERVDDNMESYSMKGERYARLVGKCATFRLSLGHVEVILCG